MCGLCGEVRYDGGPVEADGVVAMRDQMPHRGPDASGLYVSPSARAGLGFRRLKIVDLSDVANQPMPNEDGTVQVVFNGEIYNFQGLRDDLLARGHRFRSRSDTEVIAHLYESFGPEGIEQLDGMFAIAIWDERERRLVLARDRTGKKPLYYLQRQGRIAFASEMKAFFARPEFGVSIDPDAIPYYFLHGYVPCPNTFYRDVRQVEPGTVMTFDQTGASTARTFWSLQYPKAADRQPAPDRREVISTLRGLMTKAVERRLVSDVPLGAFLSGGVDSTIVVGLMSQLMSEPVKTFSIGFKDSPGYDETSFARMVANRFKTEHTEFIVEPGAFDLIDTLVWHHDGPFGDSSAVPTYLVSKLTREQVTVVLTGDGGDELFAGYLRFYAALTAERTPVWMRQALRVASHLVPAGGSARHLRSRVQRFAAAASLPLEERITRWSGLFYDDLEDMLTPEHRASIGAIDRLRYLRRFLPSLDGRSTLSQLLSINFHTYLLDDLLIKTDRCTMANSLEARSPFLDTRLIDYVAGLPDDFKLSGRATKVILREAFADLIPEEIQRRPKMGFGIPFGLWFRGALREVLHDHLLSPTARYREYVSPAYVQRLVARHDAGEADLGLQLWTLLTFEIWLRSFPGWIGAAPPASTATHG